MVLAVSINSIIALGYLIALLFCIGDVDAAVSTPTGFPIIEIYYQATKSKAGTTVLVVMLLFSNTVALFGVFASVARLTWAFARDNGMPFARYFSHVSAPLETQVPSKLVVNCRIGPPHSAYSTSRAASQHSYRCSPRSHQPWFHGRVLRHYLSPNSRSLHVVRHSALVYPYPQTSGTWPSTWPLAPWQVEYPCQHHRSRFCHLHHHLAALPKSPARYRAEHELCRTDYYWNFHHRACGLVHQR
jgi:hypothetical protein